MKGRETVSKERLIKRTKKRKHDWILLPVLLVILIALSGCAQSQSSGEFVLIGYTKAQQLQAANEMESGQCPMLNNFTNGYINLRDQVRVK